MLRGCLTLRAARWHPRSPSLRSFVLASVRPGAHLLRVSVRAPSATAEPPLLELPPISIDIIVARSPPASCTVRYAPHRGRLWLRALVLHGIPQRHGIPRSTVVQAELLPEADAHGAIVGHNVTFRWTIRGQPLGHPCISCPPPPPHAHTPIPPSRVRSPARRRVRRLRPCEYSPGWRVPSRILRPRQALRRLWKHSHA